MGLSNGYNTALKRNGDFGAKFDEDVLRWKKNIEDDYKEIVKHKEDAGITFEEASRIRRLTKPCPDIFKVLHPISLLFDTLKE